MSYCSKECQKAHYNLHKPLCESFKNFMAENGRKGLEGYLDPDFEMIVKVALKIRSVANGAGRKDDERNVECFLGLVDHFELLDDEGRERVGAFAGRVLRFFNALPLTNPVNSKKRGKYFTKPFDQGDFMRFLGIFNCNNFALHDSQFFSQNIEGTYPLGALLNHSCQPNVVLLYEDNIQIVRALRDIDAGEELLNTYVDGLELKSKRVEKLKGQYGFLCGCEKCRVKDGSDGDVVSVTREEFEEELVRRGDLEYLSANASKNVNAGANSNTKSKKQDEDESKPEPLPPYSYFDRLFASISTYDNLNPETESPEKEKEKEKDNTPRTPGIYISDTISIPDWLTTLQTKTYTPFIHTNNISPWPLTTPYAPDTIRRFTEIVLRALVPNIRKSDGEFRKELGFLGEFLAAFLEFPKTRAVGFVDENGEKVEETLLTPIKKPPPSPYKKKKHKDTDFNFTTTETMTVAAIDEKSLFCVFGRKYFQAVCEATQRWVMEGKWIYGVNGSLYILAVYLLAYERTHPMVGLQWFMCAKLLWNSLEDDDVSDLSGKEGERKKKRVLDDIRCCCDMAEFALGVSHGDDSWRHESDYFVKLPEEVWERSESNGRNWDVVLAVRELTRLVEREYRSFNDNLVV